MPTYLPSHASVVGPYGSNYIFGIAFENPNFVGWVRHGANLYVAACEIQYGLP